MSFLFCTCICHVVCFVMLYCPYVCISCHTCHYKVISSLKQDVYVFQHHTQTFSDPALVDLTRIQNNTTSNMLLICVCNLSMWNIALLMTALEDGILPDLYEDISWYVCVTRSVKWERHHHSCIMYKTRTLTFILYFGHWNKHRQQESFPSTHHEGML